MSTTRSSCSEGQFSKFLTPLSCQGDVLCAAKSVHSYFCSLDDSVTDICALDIVQKNPIIENFNNIEDAEISWHVRDKNISELLFYSLKSFGSLTDGYQDRYKSCRSTSLVGLLKDNSSFNSHNETLSDIEDISSYDDQESISSEYDEIKSTRQFVRYLRVHFCIHLQLPLIYLHNSFLPLLFIKSSTFFPPVFFAVLSITSPLILAVAFDNNQYNVMKSSSTSCTFLMKLKILQIHIPWISTSLTFSLNEILFVNQDPFREHVYMDHNNHSTSVPSDLQIKNDFLLKKRCMYSPEMVFSLNSIALNECTRINLFIKNVLKEMKSKMCAVKVHPNPHLHMVKSIARYYKICGMPLKRSESKFMNNLRAEEDEIPTKSDHRIVRINRCRSKSLNYHFREIVNEELRLEVQCLCNNNTFLNIFIISKNILQELTSTDRMKEIRVPPANNANVTSLIRPTNSSRMRSLSVTKYRENNQEGKMLSKKSIDMFNLLSKHTTFGESFKIPFQANIPKKHKRNCSFTLVSSKKIVKNVTNNGNVPFTVFDFAKYQATSNKCVFLNNLDTNSKHSLKNINFNNYSKTCPFKISAFPNPSPRNRGRGLIVKNDSSLDHRNKDKEALQLKEIQKSVSKSKSQNSIILNQYSLNRYYIDQ